MNEDSLLALLARLCGDITLSNNTDSNTVIKLQQTVATAIINDPGLSSSAPLQFEQIENFSTQHLNAADLQHLNNVLQQVQQTTQAIDTTIRIFRRQVPFISSQVRGSVPDWGAWSRYY